MYLKGVVYLFKLSIVINLFFEKVISQNDWKKYLNSCEVKDKSYRLPNRCESINEIIVEDREFIDFRRHWCVVIDNRNGQFTGSILTLEYSTRFKIIWLFAESIRSRGILQSRLRLNKGLVRIIIFPHTINSQFPNIISIKIDQEELCGKNNTIMYNVDSNEDLQDNYKFLNQCYNSNSGKDVYVKHCDDIFVENQYYNVNNEKYWCIIFTNYEQKYTKNDKLIITYSHSAKNLAWIPSNAYMDTNILTESIFQLNNDKTIIAISSNGQSTLPDLISIKLNNRELCSDIEQLNINKVNIPDVQSTTRVQPVELDVPTRFTLPRKIEKLICGQRLVKHKTLISHGLSALSSRDYPWHSAIYHHQTLREKNYACGGSLIDRKTILTAAHCLVTANGLIVPERITVELGRHDLKVSSFYTQEFQVFKVIPHHRYNPDTIENDIAILKLSTYVQLTNYVQIICLPPIDFDLMLNDGMIAGWGRDENNILQNTLKEASMPVVNKMTCLKSNRAFFGQYLTDTNFCAGHKNKTNVCRGDSGSGLVFNKNNTWYLGGITSLGVAVHGSDQCDITQYAIFTDVTKFTTWVSSFVDLEDI